MPGKFRVNAQGEITKNGDVFPVRCGNWFGLEGQHEPRDAEKNANGAPLELYVGNMWWNESGRTIEQTMREVKAQGMNMIRLPIAPQTLDANDPQGQPDVMKNSPSVGYPNAREAMEDFIRLADKNGLEVLIDIHSCSNYIGWRAGRLDANPPYVDATREGYEFTREEYSCGGGAANNQAYNKAKWLSNLREIASLPAKLGVDNIIGIDIFNEPFDYTWAQWKELSEAAYETIDATNKDLLIFVEGVGDKLANGTKVDHGDETTNPNWGENFHGFKTAPLDIPKDRLVISPHTYGPSVFVQRMFMDPSQPACEGLDGDDAAAADCKVVIDQSRLEVSWEEHFGFLRDQGYAVVIGEFGGNMDWPTSGAREAERQMWSHVRTGVDQDWQKAFVNYMKKEEIQACYWSINPESGDTGGWIKTSYDPVSGKENWGKWTGFDGRKTSLLKDLWGM